MKRIVILLSLLFAIIDLCGKVEQIFASEGSGRDPLTDVNPETIISEWEETYSRVEDYTAIFLKQERIGERLQEEETIALKFKKPFMIYLKWIKKPFKGREVIYIKGENKDLVKAHEGGFFSFIRLSLAPTNTILMRTNRHPVTEIGIGKLIELIGSNVRKGIEENEFEVSFIGSERIYERDLYKIEFLFPERKEKGYYCRKAVVFLDTEYRLPVKATIYDWNERLVESYTYSLLKLNVGLTKKEFRWGSYE